MTELKYEDLEIGKKVVIQSNNLQYPEALYNATIKEIYTYHATLMVEVNQETMRDEKISNPIPYLYSINRVDLGKIDHIYAVA